MQPLPRLIPGHCHPKQEPRTHQGPLLSPQPPHHPACDSQGSAESVNVHCVYFEERGLGCILKSTSCPSRPPRPPPPKWVKPAACGFFTCLSEPRTPRGASSQELTADLPKSRLAGRLCGQQCHHQKKRRDGTAHGRRPDRPGNEGRDPLMVYTGRASAGGWMRGGIWAPV